jgi:hypothetical protein
MPGLWMSAISRMGRLLQSCKQQLVAAGDPRADQLPIPPVFNDCSAVLGEEQQQQARNLYWQAVSDPSLQGPQHAQQVRGKRGIWTLWGLAAVLHHKLCAGGRGYMCVLEGFSGTLSVIWACRGHNMHSRFKGGCSGRHECERWFRGWGGGGKAGSACQRILL